MCVAPPPPFSPDAPAPPPYRIPFRTIVVSLLSHQVLLQNLYDILLEEFVKQPDGHDRVTPVTSDPSRATAGFLRYISMTNLAIILDLLLDSYRYCRAASDPRAGGGRPRLTLTAVSAGRRGTSTRGRASSTCS